ncbi:hypothetical protein TCAL_13673 [Tigriopus californicus]|uniref:Hexosyltransferase n=1 Tax=Tigriopus californicus TaxID=6832 RepID=A0A553PP37_TIGCA|nr:beta-1,3-galactosyltransferase 1-like [Tigriopus californicus]TRY79439.1 hypothetical protein TCAL_13673 [Tigriopus californicus]
MSQIMAKDYVVDHCQEQDLRGVKLLVGVKSVSDRFETRDTTRETWGLFQNDHPDVKVLFFTGEPSNPLTINRLRAEIQVHCDLVMVRGVDSYANRTIKAVSLLRYVNDHHLGLNPEVTMVMDDDAYLNLDRLYYLISHRLLATAVDNFITGFRYGGPVLRPPVNSTDQFVKPSVCPSYMYNGTTTPPHLSGSGYLMPRATVPCLVRQAMSLPFLHINDVFITGFCAEACGFPRVAHSQFSPGKKKLEDITCHHLLLHYQSPEARLKIFNKFVKECPSPNK